MIDHTTKINYIKHEFSNSLSNILSQTLPSHSINEAYRYSLFPVGKLFRPQLVYAIASDFSFNDSFKAEAKKVPSHYFISSNNEYLAMAIELHHAYTLIHDDLPSLDNDDFRRNRKSLHKEFNEWKAILVGDGLINLSYQMLSKIKSPCLNDLLHFFSWIAGPKGLIQGQVMDMSFDKEAKIHPEFKDILQMIELKTARLIQFALVGSFSVYYPLLSSINEEYAKPEFSVKAKIINQDLFKMGLSLGTLFQLLDDLNDLLEQTTSEHEKRINPFYFYPKLAKEALIHHLKKVSHYLKKYNLNMTKFVIDNYLLKNINTLHNFQDRSFTFFPTLKSDLNESPCEINHDLLHLIINELKSFDPNHSLH